MIAPPSTASLASSAARHPWRTLALWLVLILVAGYFASGLGDVTDDVNRSSSKSSRADLLIEQEIRSMGPALEFVVVEAPADADPAALDAEVDALARRLRPLPAASQVQSHVDGRPDLLAADGRTALIQVALAPGDPGDIASSVVDTVAAANADSEFRISIVGEGSVEGEIARLSEETLLRGEIIGISLALVILLVVMGTVVAAILPILLSVCAIVVATGAAALVGEIMNLNEVVQNIIALIGLAVGIDYSFFIVQRYREERDKGRDTIAAVTVAGATANRTVFFSGIAVAIALAGMFIIPFDIFRSLAVAAILVVAAAVAAALTLLPAVLSVLGGRVDRLRVPVVGRRASAAGESRFWSVVIKAVTARPALSVLVTVIALGAVAGFYFSINLGANGINTFPEDNDFRRALAIVNGQFSDGVTSADIVVDARGAGVADTTDAIAALEASLEADPVFAERSIQRNEQGDLTLIQATMTVDPTAEAAKDAIGRLRGAYVLDAFDSSQAEVLVGGDAAELVDAVGIVDTYLPIVLSVVLALSFLLLLLVFRSLIVPIKAILMNLLSVGAAFGLLVLVFQEGVGASLLGFQRSPQIEFWIPLFLFSILFGLSMDYHVFMLSRIKERFDLTGDNSDAVGFGLRSTGAIITGAALIMVAVFGGFAAGDLVFFQQLGFGLAVAIILDATIVRLVLVPAAMELLGDRNWYFPSWIEWLPRIQIEGREAFAEPSPEILAGPAGD